MPPGGAACINTFSYYVVEAGAADQSAPGSIDQRGSLKCGGGNRELAKKMKFTYSANNLKANTAYRFYVRSVNEAKAANSEFVAAVATTASE